MNYDELEYPKLLLSAEVAAWSDLFNCNYCHLENNMFTGPIPTEFGDLSLLRVLNLGKKTIEALSLEFVLLCECAECLSHGYPSISK